MEGKKIEIGSSTILRTILILLGFWFLFLIRGIIILLIGSFIIASAIDPVARWLRRFRVPRAISAVVVYIAFLFIAAMSVILIVPVLAQQTAQLAHSLPQLLADLQDPFGVGVGGDVGSIAPTIQQSLSRISDDLGNISANVFRQTGAFFSGLLSMIFMVIISFYLVIEENAVKKAFRFIVPSHHMKYIETIVDRVQVKLGHWVIAQLLLGVIIGVTVTIGLWIMGVPHAMALGLIAGVLEVIPVIGPIVAGIIGSFVALSSSLFLAVVVAAFYLVVQQLENHFLIPNIMRKATGLNPLVTLIALLIGAQLAGLAGAILAVPVATILSILLSDIFSTGAPEDELAG